MGEHQVQELEQLIEAGNWEALVAAGNRFDDAPMDLDSEGSPQLLSDISIATTNFMQQTLSISSHGSSSHDVGDLSSEELDTTRIVTEIAKLLKNVVPDELENLDEMLLQFRGREEELLNTLLTM